MTQKSNLITRYTAKVPWNLAALPQQYRTALYLAWRLVIEHTYVLLLIKDEACPIDWFGSVA